MRTNEKQTSWAIYYNKYTGMTEKAVNFLSAEVASLTNRQKGVHTLHVLPCYKEGTKIEKNGIAVGVYGESEFLQKYIAKDEVPENGYCLKVMENPGNKDFDLVLIAGYDDAATYYGCVDFIDIYCNLYHSVERYPNIDDFFDYRLKKITIKSSPKTLSRKIFSWGHPINDYRTFIINMARLKLNELILWNDFVPINAKQVMEYAHSYGIKIYWGYEWGWIDGCESIKSIDGDYLERVGEVAINKFENEYASLGVDGIYFQSFTERNDSNIGGVNIAEAVVKLVNDTTAKLYKKYPDLKIQFGLHATSVKDDLDKIARIDSRVEIVWENASAFPFYYNLESANDETYKNDIEFVDKLTTLRKEGISSFLYKGFPTQDWRTFKYQAGPYILGEAGSGIIENDTSLRIPYWKTYQAQWLKYGPYAQKATQHIQKTAGKDFGLGLCGVFDDGIWFPEALAARMLWDSDEDFETNMRITCANRDIRMV